MYFWEYDDRNQYLSSYRKDIKTVEQDGIDYYIEETESESGILYTEFSQKYSSHKATRTESVDPVLAPDGTTTIRLNKLVLTDKTNIFFNIVGLDYSYSQFRRTPR